MFWVVFALQYFLNEVNILIFDKMVINHVKLSSLLHSHLYVCINLYCVNSMVILFVLRGVFVFVITTA